MKSSTLSYAAAFAIAGSITEGFAPIVSSRSAIVSEKSTPLHRQTSLAPKPHDDDASSSSCVQQQRQHSSTSTHMSSNDNQEGPGAVTVVFIVAVLLFFVVSAFAPLLDFASIQPSSKDLNLGDAVVTRQDDMNKLKNYQSKFDALSPSRVQTKLSNLPVFFIARDGGVMDSNVYFSFNEASAAAAAGGGTVKVTTLDQIMYPLILKRDGFFKPTAATPVEVKNALASLGDKTYNLIPSAAASKDAKDTGTNLKEGDVPLFIIERLAFAGSGGQPQVPLFLEKADGVTSYSRLGKSDQPIVRTTSLLDVLHSMERGTRPAVGQLEFYGNADDVLKADEMSSSQ